MHKLTQAQVETIETLKERWQFVGEPQKLPLEQAVSVCCSSDGTRLGTCPARVWYCIEENGHAHT